MDLKKMNLPPHTMIWEAAKVKLKQAMNEKPNSFNAWIEPLILLENSNEKALLFSAPNPFFLSQLKRAYGELIEQSFHAVHFKGTWEILSSTDENVAALPPDKHALALKRMGTFVQERLFQDSAILPNLAAQSTLFKPTRRGKRPLFTEWEPAQLIHFQKDKLEIHFKFEQLDQADLTVWMSLIKYAKKNDELVAQFSSYEMLKSIGKGTSSRDYDWLTRSLDRLSTTPVRLRLKNVPDPFKADIYQEALAPRVRIASQKQQYAISLSRTLMSFFGVGHWTFLDFQKRLALGNNQWAQSVQAFLSSTRSPHFFKADELYSLWGENYATKKSFLADFRRRAIKPLIDVEFLRNVTESKDHSTFGFYWGDSTEEVDSKYPLLL